MVCLNPPAPPRLRIYLNRNPAPSTRGLPGPAEQRCSFDKIANVLAVLPNPAHPSAKNALAETWNAAMPG